MVILRAQRILTESQFRELYDELYAMKEKGLILLPKLVTLEAVTDDELDILFEEE